MVKSCSCNSDDSDGYSRIEYAAGGAERHEGGCDGGLKRLFVGEGICYMHKGRDMTVMMVMWMREREQHSCGDEAVNATGDWFVADGDRSFLRGRQTMVAPEPSSHGSGVWRLCGDPPGWWCGTVCAT
ncbi:PAS domain S-box protein [Sesbania bispinosa]|nr:PAS domain S-box protein [Sesbania bispinosa]